MPPRVLMIVGDFVEDYEAMVPLQTLEAVGISVDAVTPGGRGEGDKVKTAVHDFEGDATYTEKPGHAFALTKAFADVAEADYDALVLPGGRAPEYLRLDAGVIALVKAFDAAKKPIAAICHGAQILTAAGVVSGRKITAYPACGPECTAAGAIFQQPAADDVVVDGHLITSPAWPAHPRTCAALLAALGTTVTHAT